MTLKFTTIHKIQINDYKEATKEEWLEALKEEARKRGFKKGVKYNYVDKPYLIKTFEEQVKELSKWKHGKRLLQDWFPEAFEKQLEVGKVYKHPSLGEKFMFKFNGFGANNYGFATTGEWSDGLWVWENEVHLYKEATKEEWLALRTPQAYV